MVCCFVKNKLLMSLIHSNTSRILGIISTWQSFINFSLLNVGSIFTISVKTADISVVEKTPPAQQKIKKE